VIKVRVFGRHECDACKAAVEKITYFSRKWGKGATTSIDFIDMDTVDGLAEGAYSDVYDIPTVIIEDESRELVRWVKKVPASGEFRDYFLRESLDEGLGDKGIC
jgi:thiol-disulfide isomerase/thioredoxin